MNESKTTEYTSWCQMKQRCYNPNATGYSDYGGRGIQVCERWLNSYDNFLEDLGRKPYPSYSLDRIDGDGDYEPGNCRWASKRVQAQNRREYKTTGSITMRKTTSLSYPEETRFVAHLKGKYLGSFTSRSEAKEAISAEKELREKP